MNQNPLRAAVEEARERTALAESVYAALKATGKRASHRLALYRCPSGCVVLDVLNLPQGVIFHKPAYRLSPTMNATTSSAAGREKNTRDGDRRWKATTHFASECLNVTLNCDHLREVVLDKSEIQADLDARRAEVVVQVSGERCTR